MELTVPIEEALLVLSLLVSLIANALLFFRIKKAPKTESYEVNQLLSDLASSRRALVEIKRVAPADVFLRSPRD